MLLCQGATSRHFKDHQRTVLQRGESGTIGYHVADQTGAPTLADDIARAAVACLKGLRDGKPAGTYHYTAEGATTWHGLASRIWDIAGPRLGRRPTIEPIPTSGYPTPAMRPMNSRLDCAKIVATFGVVRRPWEQALDETLSRLLEEKP